jgi:NCS2 family nucleobase:cation symporter-2
MFGGLPVTSYTQNIGIIATTRVASRFVVQIAAGILILYGLCPKFGALLVAMPRSVLGGVFVLVCGMIVMSGIKLLQTARNTTANFLLVGITLICAFNIPAYANFVLEETWLSRLPVIVKLFLTNTVVLALTMAISLNLILNVFLQGDKEIEK